MKLLFDRVIYEINKGEEVNIFLDLEDVLIRGDSHSRMSPGDLLNTTMVNMISSLVKATTLKNKPIHFTMTSSSLEANERFKKFKQKVADTVIKDKEFCEIYCKDNNNIDVDREYVCDMMCFNDKVDYFNYTQAQKHFKSIMNKEVEKILSQISKYTSVYRKAIRIQVISNLYNSANPNIINMYYSVGHKIFDEVIGGECSQ